MNQETEKVLKWLVGNFDEYIPRLEKQGLSESAYTAEVCKEIIKQLLDNPEKVKYIITNNL